MRMPAAQTLLLFSQEVHTNFNFSRYLNLKKKILTSCQHNFNTCLVQIQISLRFMDTTRISFGTGSRDFIDESGQHSFSVGKLASNAT